MSWNLYVTLEGQAAPELLEFNDLEMAIAARDQLFEAKNLSAAGKGRLMTVTSDTGASIAVVIADVRVVRVEEPPGYVA